MKILVVIPSLHRGGAERVVALLCRAWAREHRVVLALFDASRPAFATDARVIDLASASRPTLAGKLLNPGLRVWRLARLIRRERPDRIISFMESANFPAILAASLTGRLALLTLSVRTNPDALAWFYRRLIPALYPLAGEVVTPSDAIARRLAAMGVPTQRQRVIPNPLDIDGIRARQNVTPAAPPLPGCRYILGVGRLVPDKGFDRLIDAYARIVRPGLDLLILGDGPERPALEQQIRRLGLERQVSLPGAVDDPYPYYRAAACFALSSRFEGYPNVLLEALACGCPVVAFDCRFGPGEIIRHGANGLLVEDGDIAGLAGALRTLADDPPYAAALAAFGQRHAEPYRPDAIAPLWLVPRAAPPWQPRACAASLPRPGNGSG